MLPEKITLLQVSSKFLSISNTFCLRCTAIKALSIMPPLVLLQFSLVQKPREIFTDSLRKPSFTVYLISRMRINRPSIKQGRTGLQVLRLVTQLHLYLTSGKIWIQIVQMMIKYYRTYNNHNKGGGQTSKGSGGAYLPASSSQNNKSIFRKHAQLLNGMGIQLENIAEVVVPTT